MLHNPEHNSSHNTDPESIQREKDKVDRIFRRHEKLKADRSVWDTHWQEVAEYIVPKKDNIYGSAVSGEKKHNKLFTSVSVQANELLASALHGMLTNPSSIWFGFSTGDDELDEVPAVKKWLQDTTSIITRVMNQSNFQTEVHEVYIDLGSFGTAVMRVEEDDDLMVRFSSRPIYEFYLDENFKGLIDTVSYEYKTTLRRVVQEFGHEFLSEQLLRDYAKDDSQEVTIIHLVEPRTDFNEFKVDKKNKAFASFHILKETKTLLKESGFNENPYITPRWTKLSGETYGRSPGMKALSDIKMVNAMQRVVIQGAQKIVDPPLSAPDDGVLLPIRTAPGSINYYRSGTKDRIEPIQTGARPDIGLDIIRDVIERIKEAFFIDQLHLREADRMTATEVIQRREEQLRTMGPILGRLHFEFLKPLIDRVFNILDRKDKLPKPPEILADMELEVKFVSQIAKAQNVSDTEDLTRVVSLIAPFIEGDPDVMDNFDTDAILRDLVNKFNIPAQYMEDPEDVEKVREARAAAQETKEQTEEASSALALTQQASQLGG